MKVSDVLLYTFDAVIWSMFAFSFYNLRDHPDALHYAGVGFAASCVIQFLTDRLGPWYDLLCLNSKELSKDMLEKNRQKFGVQHMTLAECVTSVVLQYYLFTTPGSSLYHWWEDTTTLWVDAPLDPTLNIFYALLIGRWVEGALYYRLAEAQNKDFLVM
jgi:hypothetical protein